MKKLLRGSLFVGAFALVMWTLVAYASAACTVTWAGSIDWEFEQRAKEQLDIAQRTCSKVTINIQSPGGGVINTLEVTKAMRAARKKGLIIETRGQTMVASGATFLLGAGSPGHRRVWHRGLYLVHGIQRSSWGSQTCVDLADAPKTEDQWIENHLIKLLATEYAMLSGKPVQETIKWLSCNNTQVGSGDMMVRLGLADVVDR